MLIHKMIARDKSYPNANGSVYPNNPWPSLSNPYLPSGSTSSNWGNSMSVKPQGNTMIVTAEDLKKIAKAKTYHPIDEPWEGSGL